MMANYTVTQKKNKPTPTGYYETKAEHKEEMRRISAVEKELKKHEAKPMSKAHKKG